VQEDYWAQLCQRAKSGSGRKATNNIKSLRMQLLMAADVEWTIHYNEHEWSINDYGSCKYCN